MDEHDLPAQARRVVQLTLFPLHEVALAPSDSSDGEPRRVVALGIEDETEDGEPERTPARRFRVVAAWHDPRWQAARVLRGGRTTVFRRCMG